MRDSRTTFSKFIIEDQHRRIGPEGRMTDFTALLNDIQTACKFIALAVSHGALESAQTLRASADEIVLRECLNGGTLCGAASEGVQTPYWVSPKYKRGRYLLAVDPLDGAENLDVNVAAGTIFSIVQAPPDVSDPKVSDFLVPGWNQLAAGYALYGPSSMLVVTLGAGVHGFTLDREIGAYTLTHPNMRIPGTSCEFSINASNERFWEPPVRHYVEECIAGKSGPRGQDFTMRWIASTVAEVHRILRRGGLFMYPRTGGEQPNPGLQLLFDANPMAMIAQEAGGRASTGREPIAQIVPSSLDQRVPVILGSRSEVDRIVRYHEMYDRGEDLAFKTPLFNTRSMFRSA